MKKNCKIHGLTEFAIRKDGRYRCKKCNVEKVLARRKRLKVMSVEYKGGKCQNSPCGYNKYVGAFKFHHPEPNKEFGLSSKGYTISWERMKEELNKCILLCSNCHKEAHAGILDISMIDPNIQIDVQDKIKRKSLCIDCGKKIDRKAKRCVKCYNLHQRKVNRPSINILIDDVKKLGYSGTGRKYNVCGKTIKKWLKTL